MSLFRILQVMNVDEDENASVSEIACLLHGTIRNDDF